MGADSQVTWTGTRWEIKWTGGRLERGAIGELLLNQKLDASGYHVFHDLSKNVSAKGIDLVAFDAKTGNLLVIDNKAWKNGIPDAASLTGKQYTDNLATVERYLETQTEKESLAALKALREGRVVKVLGNAFADDATRFTAGAFAKGLSVFDYRLGALFRPWEKQAWEQAFRSLVVKRGTIIVAERGVAQVGALVIAAVVAGGVLYVVKSDAETQEMAGEIGVSVATEIITKWLIGSRLLAGMMSLYVVNMDDDRGAAQRERAQRLNAIAQVVMDAVDYDKLPREDQIKVFDAIEKLADEPIEVSPPAVPAAPAVPARPRWQRALTPSWLPLLGKNDPRPNESTRLAKTAADSDLIRESELRRQALAAHIDAIHLVHRSAFENLNRIDELTRLTNQHAAEASGSIDRLSTQIAQHNATQKTFDTTNVQRTMENLENIRRQTDEVNRTSRQTQESMLAGWRRFYNPPANPQISNWGTRGWDGRPIGGL